MPKKKSRRPLLPSLEVPPNHEAVPEGERCCPICRQPMQTERREDESIDVCEAHGIWLDRWELERMSLRRARRTSRRIRRIRADAHQRGAMSGMFWGSLLA